MSLKTVGGAALALVLAVPAAGHAQSMQQMLGGLMTGNQNQDRALQDAYERGYQKGRQDEARMSRREPDYGRRPPPPPDQGGDPYYRR